MKVEGIQWPLVPNSKKEGDRSTTYSNKEAIKAALSANSVESTAKVDAERNWRDNYSKYLFLHVSTSLKSKDDAIAAAESGLKWMHSNFQFIRNEKTLPMNLAMSSYPSSFKTGTIKGEKQKPLKPLSLQIPYMNGILEGASLKAKVNDWVQYGTIEKSAGDAILDVMQNDEWRDLSDKYFVLLGASSAMGPLKFLLHYGANIVAIDLDRAHIWKNLINAARDSCGSITFPLRDDINTLRSDDDIASSAGCNLISQAPEILSWLRSTYIGKPLVVGAYAYLDGELHVRVSLAMDAIITGLIADKASHPSIIPAYLCTPTDIHLRPKEAYDAAKYNYSPFSSGFSALLRLSPMFWFGSLKRNFGSKYVVTGVGLKGSETEYALVDGIVNRQGPNYALAKRLQHWRAIVSREKDGCTVSSNIAPSTATVSVTHNKVFAMAYGGMPWFKPMEIFQQETSNAVMAALLLHDVFNVKAKGASPLIPLNNPLELFSFGSFHGGIWRLGFTVDSIGTTSVIVYLLQQLLKLLTLMLALYTIYSIVSKNASPEI